MNKWGIMVDVSHPSKGFDDAGHRPVEGAGDRVALVGAHAGNHSRNLDDEMLMAIKTNGGVVQIVAFAATSRPIRRAPAGDRGATQEFALPPGRGAAAGLGGGPAACAGESGEAAARSAASPAGEGPRRRDRGRRDADAREAWGVEQRLAEIDRKWPAAGRANVKDFVDHIDYAVKLIGIEPVGMSRNSTAAAASTAGTARRKRST